MTVITTEDFNKSNAMTVIHGIEHDERMSTDEKVLVFRKLISDMNDRLVVECQVSADDHMFIALTSTLLTNKIKQLTGRSCG